MLRVLLSVAAGIAGAGLLYAGGKKLFGALDQGRELPGTEEGKAPTAPAIRQEPTNPPPVNPPPVPPPQTPVPPKQGSAMRNVYRTPLVAVRLHPSGLVRLPSGVRVSALPLIDTDTGLFARLSYYDLLEWAKLNGYRMLRRNDVDEYHRVGLFTAPCTLVHSSADFAKMQSVEYARKHDDCFWAQLAKLPWDGSRPVLVGKDYIEGAPPGRQLEYGWLRAPGGRVIQSPGTAHEANYTDYSQLSRVAA